MPAGQGSGNTPFGLTARRFAGKHVAMGDEGVDEVGGIEDQQDERDAEAQPLVNQQGIDTGCSNPLGEVEHRRSDSRCHSGNDPLQSDLPRSSLFFKLPLCASELANLVCVGAVCDPVFSNPDQ